MCVGAELLVCSGRASLLPLLLIGRQVEDSVGARGPGVDVMDRGRLRRCQGAGARRRPLSRPPPLRARPGRGSPGLGRLSAGRPRSRPRPRGFNGISSSAESASHQERLLVSIRSWTDGDSSARRDARATAAHTRHTPSTYRAHAPIRVPRNPARMHVHCPVCTCACLCLCTPTHMRYA